MTVDVVDAPPVTYTLKLCSEQACLTKVAVQPIPFKLGLQVGAELPPTPESVAEKYFVPLEPRLTPRT